MLAKDLIKDVSYVNSDDSLKSAKELILELCVCDLPVVKQGNFVGIIPGQSIIDAENDAQTIEEFKEEFLNVFVNKEQHILDVLYIAGLQETTIVPVIDKENKYLGSIKLQDLVKEISNTYNFFQPGGIITLEMDNRDYQLSEIARILESDNAKILSLLTSFNADSTKFYVTIKLNHQDVQNIAATFERFGYKVTLYSEDHFRFNDLQDRYDYLMKFIDL